MDAQGKRDWTLVVAGVALIVLGVVFLMSPAMTLVTVAVVAGVGLVAAGVLDLISYARFREEMSMSGWVLAYAICDILLGAALLIHPLVSAAVVPWLVGACLLAYGAFELVAAWRIRSGGSAMRVDMARELGIAVAEDATRGWGWVLFGGVVAIACALAFFFLPATFAIVLSAFLVARGAMLIAYGASVRSVAGGMAAHH